MKGKIVTIGFIIGALAREPLIRMAIQTIRVVIALN